MQKLSHQIFSFSEFTLDLRRGCLLRAPEELEERALAPAESFSSEAKLVKLLTARW